MIIYSFEYFATLAINKLDSLIHQRPHHTRFLHIINDKEENKSILQLKSKAN